VSQEADWSNQLVIYGSELSYVFEAEADSADDWGFAFIVSAQGSVGESEVYDFTFNVEPQQLPVDEVRAIARSHVPSAIVVVPDVVGACCCRRMRRMARCSWTSRSRFTSTLLRT
jgi:hypothetical protein